MNDTASLSRPVTTGIAMSRRQWGILLALLLAALVPGFFTTPVMDRDEARYSQAASQMMETGDYIDIRFQEDPRWVKPVGIYWMQVATAAPFGGADAPIWAFRVPSLLGIIFAAAGTAFLASRLAGPQCGMAAGLILGLTFAAAIEARTAKTDAMLLASAAIAQAALYFLLVREKTGARGQFWGAPAIFWAATGAAILIKGPIVTMVSATTIAGYGLWMRDRSVLSRLRLLPGIALAAAIALPWMIAITLRTDGAFFADSVGHALFGKVAESDDSHAGPVGYHTLLLPVTFWPGTLLLGLGGAFAWMRRSDPTVRFLVSWILPTWIIFELVATKLPHYIVPVFPAIAVLCALALRDAADLTAHKWPRRSHFGAVGLFVIVSLVIGAVPMGFAGYLGADAVTPAHLLVAVGALAVAALGVWASLNPGKQRRLQMTLGGVLVLYWAFFEGSVPRLDPLWPSQRVSEIVAELDGCDAIAAATAGYREPSNVFYLGTQTILGADGTDAARLLAAERDCGVAVVERRERDTFDEAVSSANIPVRLVGRVEGTNVVKGRDLVLDVFVRDDGQLALRGR